MATKALDYGAWFGLAARQLGWSAEAFWAATPCEVYTALAPPPTGEACTVDELDRLMQAFPDS